MAAIAPTSQLAFGSRLLQQLLGRKGENVFASPASVGLALGIAAAGAQGKTLVAFEHALGIDATLAANWAKRLSASLDSLPPGVAVELANSLWAPASAPLSARSADAMRQSYRAEVRNLDFSVPDVVKVVNDWVVRETHGQIESAIESIDARTILLLVNATKARRHQVAESVRNLALAIEMLGLLVPDAAVRVTHAVAHGDRNPPGTRILGRQSGSAGDRARGQEQAAARRGRGLEDLAAFHRVTDRHRARA